MPLKDIGPLKLQGRFLNGTATFKIALHGGTLDVRVENVAVQSKPLPPLLLAELKNRTSPGNFRIIRRLPPTSPGLKASSSPIAR